MYPQGEIPVLDDDGLIIGESVAIIQYLAEKYGQNSPTFYPTSSPAQRSVIHHRLSFHLSMFQRRVYDYMILPMDYDYPRTEENRIKLTHALAIFDEFLKRQQTPNHSSGNSAAGGRRGLYVAGEHFTIADPPLIMATCALVAMDKEIVEPFRNIVKWLENFQVEHQDLWTIAKEGLDGLSYYYKNPRDMSHLKHPIHPVRKGDGGAGN
ncbi:Glutathione S-transferase 1, isoform C [Orchesella cincta]|uniref:Glutathione S-transferase 1, isoform C n=1 Tax=Orchesella cincta TaxID=48709 RepID=A0A1D2MIN7_ORCCI|nr:Glutathione S-transferase 1, isoform C [Orchesella cincta]